MASETLQEQLQRLRKESGPREPVASKSYRQRPGRCQRLTFECKLYLRTARSIVGGIILFNFFFTAKLLEFMITLLYLLVRNILVR